jgi:hypothetical protein
MGCQEALGALQQVTQKKRSTFMFDRESDIFRCDPVANKSLASIAALVFPPTQTSRINPDTAEALI